MKPLSSRERMMAVLRHQEPDYVPLLFSTFGFEPPAHLRWSNPVEEAQSWLSIGIDAWLGVYPSAMMFHPDVKVTEWKEKKPGERWPCMVKVYETPAGALRQEVFETDDWMTDDWPSHASASVNLLDDYNGPRYRRPLIETEEDLAKLKYLFHPPTDEAILGLREEIAGVASEAARLGVLLMGGAATGSDTIHWLLGAEATVLMAMDRPVLFDALMDIVHQYDRRNTEILLDAPVDLLMRRGYYEGTDFWSPGLYRRFFLPRIQDLADVIHQADRLMAYTMSSGCMPLLDLFVEAGYDAHYLLDPIPDGARIDLGKVKSAFENKIAVIGGLNAPITLDRGTPEAIRQEVFDAVRALGPGGGLALTPAESIYATTSWESIETLIAAWKEVREYPLGPGVPG